MKYSIITLLLLFSFKSYAQNNKADSLKQLLAQETKDTSRLRLMEKLCFEYWTSKADSALFFAQQGLALSRQNKIKKKEIRFLNLSSYVLIGMGNYPIAMETALEALKLAESTNGNNLDMVLILENLGNIQKEEGNFKQSLSYLYQAKALAEKLRSEKAVLSISMSLEEAYEKLNQLDSARVYAHKSYELADKLKEITNRGRTLSSFGNIFSKMEMDEIAIGYYRRALTDSKAENDYEAIIFEMLSLADLFKKVGQADSAFYYAHQSFIEAKHRFFTKSLFNASNFLAVFYKNKHLMDSAYYYQEIAIATKDSLFSQDKTKAIQNLNFNENLRQQEKEAANKRAIKQRKKNLQMAGIGAFIPVFFGIILLLSKRKAKTKFIEFMGLIGLLMFFEFITLFLAPYIEKLTNHTPVFMLALLVFVAFLLVPVHRKLEVWLKEKLVHKTVHKHKPVIQK